jgi:hypothetical protein
VFGGLFQGIGLRHDGTSRPCGAAAITDGGGPALSEVAAGSYL